MDDFYRQFLRRSHRNRAQWTSPPYYDHYGEAFMPFAYFAACKTKDRDPKDEQEEEPNDIEKATRAHVEATLEHEKIAEKLEEVKKQFEESEAKVKEAEKELQKAKAEYARMIKYWWSILLSDGTSIIIMCDGGW